MGCTSKTFLVGAFWIAVICAVQGVEVSVSQADKNAPAAAGPTRLGTAFKTEHATAAPQAARAVAAAAVKPAAYRGRDTVPGSHTYQAVTDTYYRPDYSSDYSRVPTAHTPSYTEPSYGNYPNANPGYQSRGYDVPTAQPGGYYSYPGTTSQPLGGYHGKQAEDYAGDYNSMQHKFPSNSYLHNGYDKHGSSGYDKYGSSGYDKASNSYASDSYDRYGGGSGYNSMQQPYSTSHHHAGYQAPSDPYSRAKQPHDPYWHSYKSAAHSPHVDYRKIQKAEDYAAPGAAYSMPQQQYQFYHTTTPPSSSYTVYGRDRAAEHARNQLALRGVEYRVASDGGAYVAPSLTVAPKVHQPTVLHLEDSYKQQQQQLLSSVLTGTLGSSGYGGAYGGQQAPYAMEAGSMGQGGLESQQWWKDHQHVQEGAKKGSTDKLDVLLSIINKLAP